MSNAQEEIGRGWEISEYAERDAVHIAVAPCKSKVELSPGQPVKLVDDRVSEELVEPAQGRKIYSHRGYLGVVDPFLNRNVEPGERFYVFIHPASVKGMRHHWSHPQFDNGLTKDPEGESRRYIERAAELKGIELEDFIHGAKEACKTGGYCFGRDLGYEFHDWPVFWMHFERVYGMKPEDTNNRIFRCAC